MFVLDKSCQRRKHQLTIRFHSYAEVLEQQHFTFIATIHKLYDMVRSGERWDFGEPGLNDRGQPVVHRIAEMLGCVRPNNDIDLPVRAQNAHPQSERDLENLATDLWAQQGAAKTTADDSTTDRASSPEGDPTENVEFPTMLIKTEQHQQEALNQIPLKQSPSLSPESLRLDVAEPFSATSETFPMSTSPTMALYTSPAPPSPQMRMMTPYNTATQVTGAFSTMGMFNQGYLGPDMTMSKPQAAESWTSDFMLGFGDLDPDAFGFAGSSEYGFDDNAMCR